ncbi:hypothetical protein WD019_13080 [Fictibacillus sp. Mic-4]|uniref:hypothetical protein n=1 Tax=Fictibacillus TaxID=1329200 RepID=UPI00042A0C16|nr:hypothetical protein [Fictibacillus gelatini]
MYDSYSTTGDDFTLFALLASFFLIFLVIGIIMYIFLGIGLMRMAKREGIENEWLAWVPIAQMYILGKIVSHKLGPNGGFILLGVSIGAFVLSFIPILGAIIGFAIGIFMFFVYHWTYDKYSDKAVLMTVFTVLTCGGLAPIFIFAIRNNHKMNTVAA